jgi:hypothetical protein
LLTVIYAHYSKGASGKYTYRSDHGRESTHSLSLRQLSVLSVRGQLICELTADPTVMFTF